MEYAIIVRPVKGQCSEDNMRSVMELRGITGWQEIVVRNCPHLDIARWRCLVDAWRQVGRNVPLLWIDADVSFLVPEALQLVTLAQASDADVLAGVYPKRGVKDPALALEHFVEPYDSNPESHVTLPALFVHMGFTVTMPSLWRKLDALADKPPAAKSPKHGMVPMWWLSSVTADGYPIGDDVAFCMRARAAGAKIAIAPNLSVSHDGQRLSREEVLAWATTAIQA